MARAVSKAVEEHAALFKRRVDVLRVSYFEAQAGEPQLVEDRGQLVTVWPDCFRASMFSMTRRRPMGCQAPRSSSRSGCTTIARTRGGSCVSRRTRSVASSQVCRVSPSATGGSECSAAADRPVAQATLNSGVRSGRSRGASSARQSHKMLLLSAGEVAKLAEAISLHFRWLSLPWQGKQRPWTKKLGIKSQPLGRLRGHCLEPSRSEPAASQNLVRSGKHQRVNGVALEPVRTPADPYQGCLEHERRIQGGHRPLHNGHVIAIGEGHLDQHRGPRKGIGQAWCCDRLYSLLENRR